MTSENRIEKVYNEYLRETFFFATHKSGLKIVFVPKKLTSFYALLGVKYGSIDSSFKCADEKEFTKVPDGIAHYLEHKMFENEDGTDAFAAFSKLGASANAFTTNNLTAYLFSCTSNFKESLGSLVDFVYRPYFTDETVEKERGIISEEIEMYEDDPYSSLHRGLLDLLYSDHPIKIDVAGTVESVSRITPEHLYRCYNAFYRPGNMVLSVSGDTDIETILDVCDKVLAGRFEGSKTESAPISEPEYARKSRGERRMPVSRPLFCIGVKDVPFIDDRQRMKRTMAASLLVDVLFGASSEFYSHLYDSGMITSMSCGYDAMRNYAFTYIIGESDTPEAVYKFFRDTVSKTLAEGLSRADFDRAKKVSVANFVKNFDSTESIATEALYTEIDGIGIDDYVSLLFEVDYDFTCTILSDFFDESKCAMMTILPQEKKEDEEDI